MVVLTIRLLSMLGCSYAGIRVAEFLNENYIMRSPQQILAIIVGIFLGLLVGYVLGGILGRGVAKGLVRVEFFVQKVKAADLFFGVFGAITGFLLALLPSIVLFRFGYPGYVISLSLFIVFGFIGAQGAVAKRSELSALLKLGPKFGAESGSKTGKILDTSVIIDGRIVDIAKAGFLEGTIVVPRFVLEELQSIADSADDLRRNRGRRGLDVLNALQRLPNISLEVSEQDFPEVLGVDSKLVTFSQVSGMPLITNDFNLNRVAAIQNVKVLNINELASALKPVVLPGEELKIKIIREGKEPGQGVGYLDDGTMVVVEKARNFIGEEVEVVATSVLQTPAGKMIFSDLKSRRQVRED